MKKSVFYLSLFLLSLTACGPAVWSPFPEADFVSYLPYTTGDKITFESDGETMVWEVTDTEYYCCPIKVDNIKKLWLDR